MAKEKTRISKKKPRILVVEDYQEAVDLVLCILSTLGHRDNVVVARDGQEGLEALRGEKFDLIISDWSMPNLNGIELLRIVRSEKSLRKIPFLFVTAESTLKDVEEAKKAGATEFIVKPYEADLLRERIAKHLP